MKYCPRSAVALLFVLAFGATHIPTTANAFDDLGDLVGYTIVAEETIDDFEGCEHGKIIQFESGRSITCSEYGYQYDYYADAVLLVRAATYNQRPLLLCKMIVDDEIYDVDCNQYMKQHIAMLRALRDRATGDTRAYINEQLQLFGNIGLR